MTRFIALFDLHFGRERVGGKLKDLHDLRALHAVLEFARDFHPNVVIFGGDLLDCGAVSHHNHGKPGKVEGVKLKDDLVGLEREVMTPVQALRPDRVVWLLGNHEDWIQQHIDSFPGLEGMLDLGDEYGFGGGKGPRQSWIVRPRGSVEKLGKLHFIHGDQLKTANPAKYAVETFERSIRFGHYHRFQAHSKASALDMADVRTGICVPALCRKGQGYTNGAPSPQATGFLWGYVLPDGTFNDYVSFIVNGKFVANGKVYRG